MRSMWIVTMLPLPHVGVPSSHDPRSFAVSRRFASLREKEDMFSQGFASREGVCSEWRSEPVWSSHVGHFTPSRVVSGELVGLSEGMAEVTAWGRF